MKKFKGNKGLLNRSRFRRAEQQKRQWLRNLSMAKAIKLEEALISSELIWQWRKNFPEDKPVCLKMGLSKKRKM